MKFLEQCCATGNKFGFQFVFIPKKTAHRTLGPPSSPLAIRSSTAQRNDIETAIYLYKKAKANTASRDGFLDNEIEKAGCSQLTLCVGKISSEEAINGEASPLVISSPGCGSVNYSLRLSSDHWSRLLLCACGDRPSVQGNDASPDRRFRAAVR